MRMAPSRTTASDDDDDDYDESLQVEKKVRVRLCHAECSASRPYGTTLRRRALLRRVSIIRAEGAASG